LNIIGIDKLIPQWCCECDEEKTWFRWL